MSHVRMESPDRQLAVTLIRTSVPELQLLQCVGQVVLGASGQTEPTSHPLPAAVPDEAKHQQCRNKQQGSIAPLYKLNSESSPCVSASAVGCNVCCLWFNLPCHLRPGADFYSDASSPFSCPALASCHPVVWLLREGRYNKIALLFSSVFA